ncbi:MAG: prolipoprotein diacylglyceryl transferase [Clostridia bacterium]|nr:prolipoprotein diacylglyceryl transferase [Clostridia bacterium]
MTGLFTVYGCTVAIGVLAAILVFLRETKKASLTEQAGDMALCLIPAGLIGARILYVLFRLPFYWMIGLEHIFYLREGGFLLYGAVAGVILAAVGLCRRRGLPVASVLDALAIPGLICIAICRLGEGSAGEGLGSWVEDEALAVFPFAVPNLYGEPQWSVFLLEAAAALVIALILHARKGTCTGKRLWTGLAMVAACQIVFESLRMDSVLKIGFVRVSQVISAVILLGIVLAGHLLRSDKNRAVHGAIGIVLLATVVGILEWALEKTQISNWIIYGVMSIAAFAMLQIALRALRGKTVL